MSGLTLCVLMLAVLAGHSLRAQQGNVAPAAGQTGSVSGHIYCADTQRPARFASVELLREEPATGTGATQSPRYYPMGMARTALDGSFILDGVPAGDYYVAPQMQGYVSAVNVSRMNGTAIAGVPVVHVSANQTVDTTVSLERGGVISGRMQYDDGSPLAGVSVTLRAQGAASSTSSTRGQSSFFGIQGLYTTTDDRGQYRISGLPAGRYFAVATVQTNGAANVLSSRYSHGRGGSVTMLTVFAPGTMHQTDARVVEVSRGGVAEGVDFTVALNGLRSIKGSVESKADSHALNGGYVSLTDTADSSLTRFASIGADGVFQMEYLPPGTYTLSIQGEDRSATNLRSFGHEEDDDTGPRPTRYQRGSATVVVGEHDVALDPLMLDVVNDTPQPTPAQTAAQ